MRRQTISLFESLETRTMMAAVPLTISQVSYMGGVQLQITGTSGNDAIGLKRTTAGLVITNTGGWTSTVAGPLKSIRIDGLAGNDSINIDTTVSQNSIVYGGVGNDTLTGGSGHDRIFGGDGNDSMTGGAGDDILVSIGGATLDSLTGGVGNDTFWTDTNEKISDASTTENNTGAVHRVDVFASSVSKELLGQKLADPTVTDKVAFAYKNFSSNPLFSESGPKANDVSQGAVGDCYFLATLSSIAKVNPTLIKQSVVDLGDGTFAVQFVKGTTKTFVRVDADLATYSWGGNAYANFGAQGSLWVAIMEKAFAFFRTGAGTYASISSGWMSEVYADFGKTSTGAYSSATSDWLGTFIKTELSAGKSVTYAVSTPSGAPLIGSHAYMVDGVVVDSKGKVTAVRLRNPWGVDGAGSDGANDGYVTITIAQAQKAFLGVSSSLV